MAGLGSLYKPLASTTENTGLGSVFKTLYGQPSLLGSAVSSSNALLTNALGGVLTPPRPKVIAWQYVRRRFASLLCNIAISDSQREDGEKKQAGVRACLNRHYWNVASETANSMLIGSWGKDTRGHPSRDIDILFLLPAEVYHRFQQRSGNRQSQLLQEVKEVLTRTYSQTTMRGDGQVVRIPFNSIPIEVAVAFRFSDGRIRVCDTNGGGNYTASTAEAELRDLNRSDTKWSGNTRALVRIAKRWQSECNVPLKSFQLERLAVEFLDIWPHSAHDLFWYDWMVRDFFGYIRGRANTYLTMPGAGEIVFLEADWLSRAETAHRNAISACENEHDNYEYLAGGDWQNIFGAAAPQSVE
jgi:hypothetical protein